MIDEFESTGHILGKGTDSLESYEFEGRTYTWLEKPRLRPEWFAPPGYSHDRDRKLPVGQAPEDAGGLREGLA